MKLLDKYQLPAGRVRSYSKGMKALLAMLLAFSTRASYIILDEPTNGLDPLIKRAALQLIIEEVAENNTTVLISTHHLDEVEKIADMIMIVEEKNIQSVVALDSMKKDYQKIQVVYDGELPEKLKC